MSFIPYFGYDLAATRRSLISWIEGGVCRIGTAELSLFFVEKLILQEPVTMTEWPHLSRQRVISIWEWMNLYAAKIPRSPTSVIDLTQDTEVEEIMDDADDEMEEEEREVVFDYVFNNEPRSDEATIDTISVYTDLDDEAFELWQEMGDWMNDFLE